MMEAADVRESNNPSAVCPTCGKATILPLSVGSTARGACHTEQGRQDGNDDSFYIRRPYEAAAIKSKK